MFTAVILLCFTHFLSLVFADVSYPLKLLPLHSLTCPSRVVSPIQAPGKSILSTSTTSTPRRNQSFLHPSHITGSPSIHLGKSCATAPTSRSSHTHNPTQLPSLLLSKPPPPSSTASLHATHSICSLCGSSAAGSIRNTSSPTKHALSPSPAPRPTVPPSHGKDRSGRRQWRSSSSLTAEGLRG